MHPSDDQLIGFLDGHVGEDVRQHLERTCPRCSERLELIRGLLASLRSDQDADPPAAWVARAVALRGGALVPPVRERLAAWLGRLPEQIARVVSDSSAVPGGVAVAGIRSLGGARRLRFEADRVELDLQIEADPGAVIVIGQFATAGVSPAPIGDASFVLLAGDSEPVPGTTDSLGEFSIDAPFGSTFQLLLRHDDRIVRFEVPPEPPPAP